MRNAHWLVQAVAALIIPAACTLAFLGGIQLVHDIATYHPVVTGIATPTVGCIIPGERFNACAELYTDQVIDLRTN